jgi:acylphosphatase
MMKRVEVRFRGRVQGVGFRATVRDIARSFAISGWVRNEADGSVVLAAEGADTELERFLETIRVWMGRNIASMDRLDGAPVGEHGFEVRH